MENKKKDYLKTKIIDIHCESIINIGQKSNYIVRKLNIKRETDLTIFCNSDVHCYAKYTITYNLYTICTYIRQRVPVIRQLFKFPNDARDGYININIINNSHFEQQTKEKKIRKS